MLGVLSYITGLFFISSWVTIQMLTGCIPLLCLWLAGVVPHLFSKRGYIWWHKCFNATMCVPAPLLALMHMSVESSQFDVSWGGPFFLAPGVLRLWKMRWRLVSWSPQTLHGALGGGPDLTTHCHWEKRLALFFAGIASNAFMGSRTWEALLARWALGLCLVVFVGIAVLRCGWWSLGIICYWYWSTGCGEAIAKCIWDEPQLQQYRTGGLQILKGVLFGQKKAWCDREGVFIYVEDNRA